MIERFNLAWLSLTYDCPNRCRWCYAAANDSSCTGKTLDSNLEEPIIRLLKDLNVPRVILIGGEPSVYHNIINFVGKLDSAGIKVGMVSNGRRFNNNSFAQQIKQNGLNSATFSIEGSCAEIHDFTTQVNGSYVQAINGIKNAVSNGIRVSSNTVISTINLHDLEKTVDSLAGLGLEGMSFNISGVCVSQEGNNEYMANPRVAIEAFEKAYLHAKSRGIKARLVTPMPLCNFNPDLLLQLKEDHAIGGSPCQLHHGKNFVLDYNGDVVPCTHLTGFPYFNILNEGKVIPASEFVQKYNSVEANQFRTKFGRYASTKCDGCKERCSGGCPLYWIKLNPDEVIKGISIPEPSTALLAGAGALGLGALGSRSRRTDAKKY